jgi:4-diphosphocytidyl-2-C-methyl-D-erythritol kinase
VKPARIEHAPAKVNLTLAVIGRRVDGYHDIESLVAFAAIGDTIAFTPGRELALTVRGPTAHAAGPVADNLVLKAARALAERVNGIKWGRFVLSKRLPAAAGIGGGSSDAGAALRLLARANRLTLDDPRLHEAAGAVGADVPVCLDPRARIMRGRGEILSEPVAVPRLPAVLANPGIALSTRAVFAKLVFAAACGPRSARASEPIALDRDSCLSFLSSQSNDLEAPARAIEPAVGETLATLRAISGCRLARMSGSGGTCFALFDSTRAAASAAKALRERHSGWWIRATTIG